MGERMAQVLERAFNGDDGLLPEGWTRPDFLTPPDIDVADLRFTVERRPESDERDQKPVAVVIEMTLRKPTPGAKARRNNPNETEINPNETDVPSIFVRRRVRVVLPNVP
jgi:hypothetical protein